MAIRAHVTALLLLIGSAHLFGQGNWASRPGDSSKVTAVFQFEPLPNGFGVTLFPFSHGTQVAVMSRSPLADGRAKVWMLMSDGSALSLVSVTPGISAGVIDGQNTRVFHFAPVPANEIAGIVVSLDGKLHLRTVNPK
jgi:hypothetical protein